MKGIGPSLVHQTYANLLDDTGYLSQALDQRRITAKLEPNDWSCDALIEDLDNAGLHDEASRDRIIYARYLTKK